MCCQRSTARPNRHKSIRGEMKRAEAWWAAKAVWWEQNNTSDDTAALIGQVEKLRMRRRLLQHVYQTAKVIQQGPTSISHPTQHHCPQTGSIMQHEAGGLDPVAHRGTRFNHRGASIRSELPWEFNNTTLYFSASTFTASRNCEVTHADFHFTITPSDSNLLHFQFCG